MRVSFCIVVIEYCTPSSFSYSHIRAYHANAFSTKSNAKHSSFFLENSVLHHPKDAHKAVPDVVAELRRLDPKDKDQKDPKGPGKKPK